MLRLCSSRHESFSVIFFFCVGPLSCSSHVQADYVTPNKIILHSGEKDVLITDNDLAAPAYEASAWDGKGTYRLIDINSYLLFEYSAPFGLSAIRLQADNNDTYFIESSVDGVTWFLVWRAPPTAVATGLSTRTWHPDPQAALGVARFLRVRGATGDGRFSVRQFVVTSGAVPADFQEIITAAAVTPEPGLFSLSGGTLQRVNAILTLFALGWWIYLYGFNKSLSLSLKWKPLVFVCLAVGGFAGWFRFGQFHYSTTVHYWDFFHYYVGAKYAREVDYDRLYVCAAAADEEAGRPLGRYMRDLRTNVIVESSQERPRFRECRNTFSEDRWKAFSADISYFASTMEREKWHSLMLDHGYNPSPAWTLVGGLIANMTVANEDSVRFLAQLDTLLLICMWLIVLKTFGLESAACGLVFWGASYPAHYGWIGGSFLRNDWLCLLVTGICALKAKRSRLGVALITWSSVLRIFPGIILVGLGLSTFWRLRRKGRAEVLSVVNNFAVPLIGTVFGLVAASSLFLSDLSVWTRFEKNLTKHASTLYTNSVGWPTVVSQQISLRSEVTKDLTKTDPLLGWKEARLNRLKNYRPLLIAPSLIGLILLVRLSFFRPDWQVAILSLCIVPLSINLANYYYGFLAVMALLSGISNVFPISLLMLSVIFDQILLFTGEGDMAYLGFSQVICFFAMFWLCISSRATAESTSKPCPE